MGDADLVVLCLVALSRHCREAGSPLTLSWHPAAYSASASSAPWLAQPSASGRLAAATEVRRG